VIDGLQLLVLVVIVTVAMSLPAFPGLLQKVKFKRVRRISRRKSGSLYVFNALS
jgi:hypothetical protein